MGSGGCGCPAPVWREALLPSTLPGPFGAPAGRCHHVRVQSRPPAWSSPGLSSPDPPGLLTRFAGEGHTGDMIHQDQRVRTSGDLRTLSTLRLPCTRPITTATGPPLAAGPRTHGRPWARVPSPHPGQVSVPKQRGRRGSPPARECRPEWPLYALPAQLHCSQERPARRGYMSREPARWGAFRCLFQNRGKHLGVEAKSSSFRRLPFISHSQHIFPPLPTVTNCNQTLQQAPCQTETWRVRRGGDGSLSLQVRGGRIRRDPWRSHRGKRTTGHPW